MSNEQQTAPHPEQFTSLAGTVHDDTAGIVRRSKRRRWLVLAVAAVALVAAAIIVAVLAARPDKPAPRMTPELAATFVIDEFPGDFKDPAKLITLFNATCHTLDEGNGSRTAATLPMLQGGLSSEQASYILDIAIDSTCPQYH